MLLSTYLYTPAGGWDGLLDSALDSDSTLLIVFGASNVSDLSSGIADLRKTFPRSVWIGCSTAGEIYGRSLGDNTLAVAVMKFTDSILRVAASEFDDPNMSLQAGSYLASTLEAPNLKGLFVLSDGLSVNGSELAKGLSQNLPQDVVVTGGLAGDGDRFKNTWVLVDKVPQSHHIVAVGLYGDHVGIGHGSRGGMGRFGAGTRGHALRRQCALYLGRAARIGTIQEISR
ncbi:MAG: FIST N-terminal domain-containing protein [Gallionellaceae bacterium]